MKPNKLKELGYPSNIRELIEKADGVELIEETKDQYIIHDTYNDEDRVLHVNKEPGYRVDFFQFFNNDIDSAAVIKFAKSLPEILFMNLNKVYFVEKDDDLEGEVDEISPNHTFHLLGRNEPVGLAVYRDSVAFINLKKLKKAAREEKDEDIRTLGYTKGEEAYLLDGIFQTLAHELFHLAQFNPLIEELIPYGEEAAEEFCRYY
jgi:hypothetical protein